MTDGPESFGELVRAGRIRMRLTQRQLASRAGVSVRTVRHIEQGQVRRPRPESVRRLAAVLGLDGADPLPAADDPPTGGGSGAAGLLVAVLGPLAVHRDGVPVDVGPAKQRALLGLLALQPGHVVGQAEIIDVLWGDDPPDSCRNLVHTYITRLRKVLGSQAIVRDRAGYTLAGAAGDRLDLARFDGLVARADAARRQEPAVAADLYGDALAYWRGAVLADLPVRLHQHPAAVAVARRRVAAALAHADLAIEQGGHDRAVEQLWRLLEQEPLHEGLHAKLMTALAGSGQQTAALRVFEGLRVRLSDELGVSPGAEVQEAHLRVLQAREPVAAQPRARSGRPVPAQLPADVPAFTGRRSPLERLDAGLGQGGTAILLIVGSAGVGKTALAVHWAHRVRERFPDGQLYVDLRGYDSSQPLRPIRALTLILRSLGVPAARVPTGLDEAAGLYRSLLAERRVLIVLDNCNGVDQVRPLLLGAAGCAVVITSRNRLGGLVAREGAHRIVLHPLPHGEAVALLTAAMGRRPVQSGAVAELARLCAYLPLAMRVSAANLDNDPHRSVADYVAELTEGNRLAALQVDGDSQSSVRVAFDLSYEALPAEIRRSFRLLGLIPGPDFTVETVAALAAVPAARAERALAHLAAVHLLQQHAPGRYAFHDLLRLYAGERARTEDGPEERRAAVDRLHGWYLGTAASAADLLDSDRPRFVQAAAGLPRGGPRPATAAEAVAWLEAERANLIAAITASAEQRRHLQTWQLALVLAQFFFTRGYVHDWIDTHGLALAAARELGDRRVEAEILRQLGLAYWRSGQLPQALEHHRRALAMDRAGADLQGEAKTLNHLGFIFDRTGRAAEALGHQQRSADLYRQVDDRWGEGRALIGVGNAHRQLGSPRESLHHFQEALAVNREVRDRWGEGMALAGIGYACIHLDRHPEALTRFDEATALTREVGDRTGESLALAGRGLAHLVAGRPARAMDDFQHALTLTRDTGDRWTESLALTGKGMAQLATGGYAEAMSDFAYLLALTRDTGDRWCESFALAGLGHVNRHFGRHDQAIAQYRRALECAREVGNQGVQAQILSGIADAYRAMGDRDQALLHSRYARSAAHRAGDRPETLRFQAGADDIRADP
ncbi:SARP family transcriptional regulator [Actinomadura craniellae]|uniref:SARP family transcriptional regulator n=1 Tax=Actinomadura craniellae TaxID=2231787 RepID=A0A365GZ56_9ACTN|nr:BTAD domain-containing putative transcriptional regulator [Actinomadura craniellae]RAY12107.1 SARP family transcriptional regulator [Actinomadura craniellae]